MQKISMEDIKNNEKFEKFYNFLIDYNKKINLTTITEKESVFEKHFLDSVQSSEFIANNSSVLDVGAGAGFPSIPLAIVRPDLKFTLLDSLNKRILFLNLLKKELNLENITSQHIRIEDFSEKNEEKFDYVVARAVAPLSTLLEYCAKSVKIDGKIIAYKGASYKEEISSATNSMKVLGLKLIKTQTYMLKNENLLRSLLIFSKIVPTPKQFPRKFNKPRTMPL